MNGKYQKFSSGFQVEEVENGFILYVGKGLREGFPANTFVFQSHSALIQFITKHIEGGLCGSYNAI